ncbi:hypothetical protein BH10PSE13_BH10PSE13_16140 [soil metagenome]
MGELDQNLAVGQQIRPFPSFGGAMERTDSPPHGVKLVEARLGNFSVRYARIDRRPLTRSPSMVALLAMVSVITAAGAWVWHSLQPVVAPAIHIVLQGSPPSSIPDARPSSARAVAPRPDVIPPPVPHPAAATVPAMDNHRDVAPLVAPARPADGKEAAMLNSRDTDFTRWKAVRIALNTALVSGEVQDWTEDAAFGVVVPGPIMEGSNHPCRNVAILKRQEGREAETRSGTGCLNKSGAVILTDRK